MSNYKSFYLRQLGIKESTMPSTQTPDQEEEGQLGQDAIEQGSDKFQDLLKTKGPVAMPSSVIGLAVRGSSTGGFPSGMDQTGISPSTPTGRLGGYEPIKASKDNSQIVNKTPGNETIGSKNPIGNDNMPTNGDEHPHQIQQLKGNEAPQDLTGAASDPDSNMKVQNELPNEQPNQSQEISIDVADNAMADDNSENPEEEKPLAMSPEGEKMRDHQNISEGKHKAGCKCGFCSNKGSFGKKKEEESKDKDDKKLIVDKEKSENKVDETFKRHIVLMKEYLGLNESKCKCRNPDCKCECMTDECITCGCGKPNTQHATMDKEKAGFVKVNENLPDVKEPDHAYCTGCGKKMEPSKESPGNKHLTCPKCLGYKKGEVRGSKKVDESKLKFIAESLSKKKALSVKESRLLDLSKKLLKNK